MKLLSVMLLLITLPVFDLHVQMAESVYINGHYSGIIPANIGASHPSSHA